MSWMRSTVRGVLLAAAVMSACDAPDDPDEANGATGGSGVTAAGSSAGTAASGGSGSAIGGAGGSANSSGGSIASGGSVVGGSAGEDASSGGSPGGRSGGLDAGSGGSNIAGTGGTVANGATGGVGGGDGSTDAGGSQPGCQGLAASCGALANETCCAGALVAGGTFFRSFDGVNNFGEKAAATVSDFRLDKYEVTVGRFRKFVAAAVGGWKPAAGSGKHGHLNGGTGLAATGGGYESGWSASWDAHVHAIPAAWDGTLKCDPQYSSWTPTPDANENRPTNCVSWFQAYAFCIWDGGFLPSEAEWNYAASGGNEQRVYPWSTPASSLAIDCTHASHYCIGNGCGDGVSGCSATDLIPVGTRPAGNGRWGQADLAGNVQEWNLDWHATPYVTPCTDCAHLTAASDRVVRGGSLFHFVLALYSGNRLWTTPETVSSGIGFRCARAPQG